MSKGATIPINSNWENGRAYSICLPDSENNLWFGIITGLIVQLSYGYFWDGTNEEVEFTKNIGIDILNNWLDGTCAMPTCEQIIDCIENNADTRQALSEWFESTRYNDAIEYLIQEMQKSLIAPPVGAVCEDSAYAGIVAIIDEIDASIIDFYEQAELVTNIAEFASNIAEIAQGILLTFGATIGVGIATAIDGASELINQIKDNLYEQYLAGMTQELKDEFACDILCLYGCDVTLENIKDYFKNAIASSTEFDSYLDIFDYLVVGNFTGTLSVKASFYCTLELVLKLNRLFYAFTSTNTDAIIRLQKVAQVGAMTPSDAWEILCDPCGVQEFHLELNPRKNAMLGYSYHDSAWNPFDATNCLQNRYYNGATRGYLWINFNLGNDILIETIRIKIKQDANIYPTSDIWYHFTEGVNSTVSTKEIIHITPRLANIAGQNYAIYEFSPTVNLSVGRCIRIGFQHRASYNAYSGYLALETIEYIGIGDPTLAQGVLKGTLIP